jgi:hypothetical protein
MVDNGSVSTSDPRPARRGYGRSVGGMIGALLASFGLIAFVWGLTRVQGHDQENPTPTVHYAAALAQARSDATFPVLAPTPEPADLRATSVSWNPLGAHKLWHLGFLTSATQYVGLYEGTGSRSAFLAAHTPATHHGVATQIAGRVWQTLTSSGGETAFVSTSDGVTTVVTGTAPRAELASFVASLR